MNTRIATTLLAAASLAAFAEEPAAPAAELEEEGNLPGVTLGADYCSRQVTRGLPDNTEGIVTLSAALEWLGFTAEVDGIFNTTDIAEEDGFDAGEPQHNATTIGVRGIAYRADPALTQAVDSHCTLERGAASRLRRSPLTAAERVAAARRYLADHPFMRTADYAALTGLSLTTAGRELRRLTADAAASGIVARGRSSARVYVLAG